MGPVLALRLWRVAAVATTAAVLLLLLLPGHRLPVASLARLDTLAHAASYVLIGVTWHRAGVPVRWLLGLGLLMAVGTEVAQGTLASGRSAELGDVAANIAGLLAGVAASWAVGRAAGKSAPRRGDP